MTLNTAVSIANLEYDDDGHLDGMNIIRTEPAPFGTVQSLLQRWIPANDEGGYDALLGQYSLNGIIDEQKLERLFTDPKTTMGKHMAGILSLLVPAEYCSWRQVKNLYERGAVKNNYEKVDTSEKNAMHYIDRLAATQGLEFKDLLCLYRRFRLKTQEELANAVGVTRTAVVAYEKGASLPEYTTVNKLCNALGIENPDIRLAILSAATPAALPNREGKNWRRELKAFAGGGSLFGAMLYHLRMEKGWHLQDVAERAGISKPALSEYERGAAMCEPFMVHKLCDALEATSEMRVNLLDAAGKGALVKLQGEHWREALKAFAGGGSLFGALLYHLRKEKGWSQEKLANEAGIKDRAIIRDYEKGKIRCGSLAAHTLCDALAVDGSMRFTMLNAASHGALEKLDGENWRDGLKAITGSGSVFGALLYQLRMEKGLLQEELANKIGNTQRNISLYEKGTVVPNPQTIRKLCDALQVSEPQRELLTELSERKRSHTR